MLEQKWKSGLVAFAIALSIYAVLSIVVIVFAYSGPAPTGKNTKTGVALTSPPAPTSSDDRQALDYLAKAQWQRQRGIEGRERYGPISSLGGYLAEPNVSESVRKAIFDFLVEYQTSDQDPAVQEYLEEALRKAPASLTGNAANASYGLGTDGKWHRLRGPKK